MPFLSTREILLAERGGKIPKDPFKIGKHYQLPGYISFSGGRTSGYMLYHILEAYKGKLPKDLFILFCNTGLEVEETLEFVRDCQVQWNAPIVWLEYKRDTTKPLILDGTQHHKFPKIGCHGWKEVDFDTASRKGEPFESIIDVKIDWRAAVRDEDPILPNVASRWCSGELKASTMDRWMWANGHEVFVSVVGLRADEPSRVEAMRRNSTQYKEFALPLDDAIITEKEVLEFWKSQKFDLQLKHDPVLGTYQGNCRFCLAGETEVVTSKGIYPIRDLAGKSPELLVPKLTTARGEILSEVGHFVSAPVSSFGVQRLWKINLVGHGRAKKTVFATRNHRWFLTTGRTIADAVITGDLKSGDKLRNLSRSPIGRKRGNASRLGAMRGFVFGDGSAGTGGRPGTVDIHEGKDEVFVPFFAACCGQGEERKSATGKTYWNFYGIPNFWKTEYPNLHESRHYLMGWLSGWFAADGCVSEMGNCILSSANRIHLEFARSVCAVLGIQCTQIVTQRRKVVLPGTGKKVIHSIHGIKLNRHHVTEDFFWLKHHNERVESLSDKQVRRYGWTVESVERSDRIEEVFCATVDGIGAFGLADNLMTGNCFLKNSRKIAKLVDEAPEELDWWARMEEKTHATFSRGRPTYRQLKEEKEARIALEMCVDEDRGSCSCTD